MFRNKIEEKNTVRNNKMSCTHLLCYNKIERKPWNRRGIRDERKNYKKNKIKNYIILLS